MTVVLGLDGVGVPDSHHPLTHHRGQPDLVERVTKINCFHLELFARFVARLRAASEGGEPLLSRVFLVYGSGLSDGDRHTHDQLPVLLLGGGSRLKTGRHLAWQEETPMTNLFLTLLDHLQVEADTLGDSTGRLDLA